MTTSFLRDLLLAPLFLLVVVGQLLDEGDEDESEEALASTAEPHQS